MNQINELKRKSRILFVIDGCSKCQNWEEFINRINMQTAPQKRIKIINSTVFNMKGIYTHPLQRIFERYIEDFPVLFFEGRKITSTNTRIEAEAYIRSALHRDFIISNPNPYISEGDCRFVRTGLFRRKTVICED